MNYLAHAYFSNNNDYLLVGNFIADHIRGNNLSAYHQEIIKGIELHRKIDSFTDCHAAFKASKRLFYNGFEKHSGILIDIYLDHYLANNFSDFSDIKLNEFAKSTYSVYEMNRSVLPESSNMFLDYVIKNNIYEAYAEIEGIEKVLYHLSHRIKHDTWLNNSIEIFLSNKSELENNFEVIFNDAKKEFLNKNVG
ncbi:MAG: DUF479 domain-containing protein [Bacteroidia bacterium]|nr:DUF479 domain-containing protein [Bacteroidia bacterium]